MGKFLCQLLVSLLIVSLSLAHSGWIWIEVIHLVSLDTLLCISDRRVFVPPCSLLFVELVSPFWGSVHTQSALSVLLVDGRFYTQFVDTIAWHG